MRKGLEIVAAKGRVLTLGDVIAFTEAAMRDDAPQSLEVHARVSFGGKLQKIMIVHDTDDTTKE